MYLLDTDHVSLLEWGSGTVAARLRARLRDSLPGEFFSSIVSCEEQTKGRLLYLARARTEAEIVEGYRRFCRHLETWREIPVLAYDARAAVEFQRIRTLKLRVPTLDLRIAAIALVNGATLLTRNLTDFRGIPDLVMEDWTA